MRSERKWQSARKHVRARERASVPADGEVRYVMCVTCVQLYVMCVSQMCVTVGARVPVRTLNVKEGGGREGGVDGQAGW